ncbi:hypothetical protein QLQ12_30990 [Actinoplanes sp. NEAU-A12]|uniref:Integral membrane protein n=1 Tax=Actinoplanes sandaracinus TaxID=3045177 RepID=A0ABT6WTK9_9ACTN|nr:hypothetical protein [Actinoplanes sandaracinus]MDI6103050.1 hypothetical protein [Actinoplanes sandaracinus]
MIRRASTPAGVGALITASAIVVATVHHTWSVSLVFLAWTLLGVTAAFSLSGSV